MQRKRHINFKLHGIPILLNMKKSTSRNSSLNSVNNYNYEKNNVKSNVLYSIPCVKSCAFLCIVALSLLSHGHCFAVYIGDFATDSGTISPVTGGTSTPATASLSLSNSSMASSAVTPGSTATVSTNVTVSVGNSSSYSLTLKMDKTNLTSGSTTIVAGNATTDNTWGYKWDNASNYTAPSTTAQTLATPALSNSAASFTKTLTFAAKFASNADAGHYRASGTLSLVATPKTAVITLANLTQMQQLAPDYAPDACADTVIPAGQDYAGPYTLTDVRDNNAYTVYKFKDGKCWMTQNLKLSNIVGTSTYGNGRTLNSTTSDISASTWTLPASSTSGFSDNAASNAYLSGSTGYYTWCAATAGTCSSATSQGANATSSICPKGWKLPVGYQSDKNNNDFWKLFRNMGLTISNDSLASTSGGYTSWGSGDLAKAQGSPYNFAYTGYMNSGSLRDASSYGYWWSRTAYSSSYAYYLSINSGSVYPGTTYGSRQYGFAVRCVAQ